MPVPTARRRTHFDADAFIKEYYAAWGGTDENRIMSYYAENVTVQIPGCLMHGKSAVCEQFVRPFIAAFPGNRHHVKNSILGQEVITVEFTFEAEHKGPFAGHAATDARIEVPGCGVYEFNSEKQQITAARIYIDPGALLKQITDLLEPRSRAEQAVISAGAIEGSVGQLDLATVVEVSQALSSEIVVEKLVD